jgi:zinc protease
MIRFVAFSVLAAVISTLHVASGCASTPSGTVGTSTSTRTSPDESFRKDRPPAGPAAVAAYPVFQTATLKNGIQVVVVEDHSLGVVHAAVVTRAGSALDQKELGLAELTYDAMMHAGTGDKSGAQVENAFADIGATVTVDVLRDGGRLQTAVLSRHLPRTVELFGLVLQKPSFTSADVERIRDRMALDAGAVGGEPETLAESVLTIRMRMSAAHPRRLRS